MRQAHPAAEIARNPGKLPHDQRVRPWSFRLHIFQAYAVIADQRIGLPKVTVTGTDYQWFYLEGSKWEKLVTKVFSVKEKFSLTVYAVKGEELASDAVTITLEPAE